MCVCVLSPFFLIKLCFEIYNTILIQHLDQSKSFGYGSRLLLSKNNHLFNAKKESKEAKAETEKEVKNKKKILNSTLIRPELPKSCLEYRPIEKID